MSQNHALQLFERLVRNEPALRAWLELELAKQIEMLVNQNDDVQMRKAQGHAQCLRSITRQLDDAKERLSR